MTEQDRINKAAAKYLSPSIKRVFEDPEDQDALNHHVKLAFKAGVAWRDKYPSESIHWLVNMVHSAMVEWLEKNGSKGKKK